MKRIVSILLSVLLLIALVIPCSATGSTFDWAAWEPGEIAAQYGFADQTLDEIMAQFMDRYGLSEENFSMAYYATGSGERWYFAEDVYRVAASTYKLALNMFYYDLEREGVLSPDSLIEGHSLRDMHYKSIVLSDNDLSMIMLYNLGEFWQYRDKIKRYCDQEYPIEYYTGNNINAGYLLSAMEHLYEHAEDYEQMLEYLLIASPGRCFRLYDSPFPIAHKYGWFATYIDPEEEAEEPAGEDVPMAETPVLFTETEPDTPAEPEFPSDTEFEPPAEPPAENTEQEEPGSPEGPVPDGASDEEPAQEEEPKELVLKSIAANDVAIVYTPEPYLLAVLIEDLSDHEHVLGKLCELMTEYTVWQTVQSQKAQAGQGSAEPDAPQVPDEPDIPATPEAETNTPPSITVTEHPELEPAPPASVQPEPPTQAEPAAPAIPLPVILAAAGIVLCVLLIAVLIKTRSTVKR